MKLDLQPIYIIFILVQVGIIVFVIRRSKKERAKTGKPDNEYESQRKLALSVTPAELKLAIPHSETLVYGVVMDWDIGDAMVTIAAYITGAANMYFSTGGGKSGGGKKPAVGEAAVDFVTTAQHYLDKATTNVSTSLPAKGFVRFYFLTNQRTFMLEERTEKLENSSSEFFSLFQKGNDIVNAMHSSGNGNVPH
jgi:hypothetical protein